MFDLFNPTSHQALDLCEISWNLRGSNWSSLFWTVGYGGSSCKFLDVFWIPGLLDHEISQKLLTLQSGSQWSTTLGSVRKAESEDLFDGWRCPKAHAISPTILRNILQPFLQQFATFGSSFKSESPTAKLWVDCSHAKKRCQGQVSDSWKTRFCSEPSLTGFWSEKTLVNMHWTWQSRSWNGEGKISESFCILLTTLLPFAFCSIGLKIGLKLEGGSECHRQQQPACPLHKQGAARQASCPPHQ